MVLVRVLDHRDLELARQADDRRDREHVHRDPAVVERPGRVDVDPRRLGPREDHLESAAGKHHEEPDREQCRELHHRLERNRRDDTMMLLVGIDVPRAEQHREQRHARRHAEREPDLVDTRETSLAEGAGAGDGLDRRGHGLQLQCDVGRNADDRDHRDQDGKAARLAEARGDEVGDRGEALIVADADEPPQDEPPADEDQRRPEIDREILETIARGRAHRAVEGPTRAVDGDGEGVDDRRSEERGLALLRVPVAQIGDDEQKPDIGDAGRDDEVGAQHQLSSSGSLPFGWPGRRLLSHHDPAISAAQATKR